MPNQITAVGNVGNQPVARTTPWGDLEVTFNLATAERRRNRETQQWEDGPTTWLQVRATKQLAEHVRSTVDKGQRVIAIGKLRVRKWESERGSGTAVELDADHIGPDLQHATARVERVASSGAATSQAAPELAPASPPDTSAGPGAGAGQWASPLADASDEPPF